MCQLVWLHLENYWSSGEYSDDADGDILIFVWGKMRVPRFQRTFIFKLKALLYFSSMNQESLMLITPFWWEIQRSIIAVLIKSHYNAIDHG